jgi:hypothetical protein
LLEDFSCRILHFPMKRAAIYIVELAGNAASNAQGILAWLCWLVEQAVARTSATFRQADLVRAVKAARAAGLPVTATQIAPDGTIKLIHTEKRASPLSDYDRFEADL